MKKHKSNTQQQNMTNNINTYGIIKIKDNVIVKLDLFSISIQMK